MGERLGKQVIVDNRPGAGTVIGTELVANAPKDGYTLLIDSLTHTINPWLYKLPFDPIKAFAPISMIASGPIVLVVNPELPAKSVNELIALARAQPGKLQYASAASAPSRISARSCSSLPPASTSCTYRSGAAVPPSST